MSREAALQKMIKLAAITGLRAAMGPALLAVSSRRPEGQALAVAALGEMVVDKLPLIPSRSSTALLIPRALAGAWVAKTVMEEEGIDEPFAPVYGAAIAIGTATVAPMLRGILRRVLRIPDPVLGMAEDYLILKTGSEAVGVTLDELKSIAIDSVTEMAQRYLPGASEPQSVGAGSM